MNAQLEEVSGSLVLGRYRIIQQLARGGMGIVYLARTEGAEGFTRPVIIKRIIPDLAEDKATERSFVREARILANLQHPGIVNVIDFDQEHDAYVMVLEYVHGYNLGQWHKYVVDTRKQMQVDHAIYIMTRVLDALHYAHTFVRADGTAMQIVHRDVSPGNILIDTQGHVKLLDFGIARADQSDEYKTRDGMFKGKLTYAAPEVYDGSSSSPKSDVYSSAVVLYQLLSGENPFRGKNMPEIVRRVLTETLPPISPMREDVTPEIDDVLAIALAKDPNDRYPSAAAFADALRGVRPNREEDFVTEFIDDVWNDFNGPMPDALGLEPLQKRDAAWRDAQGGEGGHRATLSSTPPSGPPGARETPARPPFQSIATEVHGFTGSNRPTRMDLPRRPATPWATWISAGAVVLAAGAALFAWSTRSKSETTSRFVVVEKEARDETTANPVPSVASAPALPAPTTPVAASSAAVDAPAVKASAAAVPAPANSATKAAGQSALLSRAVQQKRGAIESCFQQNVKEVDGRPEVSVHFRVAASGSVESADLNPGTLNGTPLGQCLIGVANRINFGPQSEPVSFTIPITARRVK